MRVPKVLIFAPADPTEETHKMLQSQGCELLLGNPAWEIPSRQQRSGDGPYGRGV